jgi:hypothetical protein
MRKEDLDLFNYERNPGKDVFEIRGPWERSEVWQLQ